MNHNKFQRITISGGEPTLHPDFFELVGIASKQAKNVIFSTNGILLKRARKIFSSFPNVTLAISLHGIKEIHDRFVGLRGAFDSVIRCIESAIDIGIPVHVYTIITRETLESIEQLSNVLRLYKIKEHRLNLVKPSGRVLTCRVSYSEVLSKIRRINLPYKISIKRRDQPFLFVNAFGKEEIRNVRRY
jgi:MoaA/NifB/PqqE/SkfB family radical SAM enzyme